MLPLTDLIVQTQLQPELLPNEKILWAGKPRTGIIFRLSDMYIIPSSLLFFAFSIFWESGASQGDWFFTLWGIPFIAMALYMVFGRFIYDKITRDHTVYGITESRILIRWGAFKPVTDSYYLSTLSNIRLEDKANGSGNIVLTAPEPLFRNRQITIFRYPWDNTPPNIELIDNVRDVYNLILKLQQNPAKQETGTVL